ncbi:TauD/TfdA family dioxygenase [Legionella gresilensis]|uniref:TauD/TfdA family dioxygenase n=1 Tax=Legionella gresilensis TaxID=91823 RepID=UPI0013EF60FF|nr:TauD/TfdA family dioxygenase [Legionella gresilensis]
MQVFNISDTFPTLVTLRKNLTFNELLTALPSFMPTLEELLLKRGAILFRGFPLIEPKKFVKLIKEMNLGKFANYIGGDSPRSKIMDGIYTSTEAPANIFIPLHQELSYLPTYPKHIYFFCETEPVNGGETIIGDAREIYRQLNPELVARFNEKKITYVAHYYYQSKIMDFINQIARSHKSWSEVFETTSFIDVEKFCQKHNIQIRWLKNNWLEMKQSMPPLMQHPITQETVWFNQAHLYDFNPKLLGLWGFLATKLFYFRRLTRLHEVAFANGEKIPRKDIYHIMDTLKNCTIAIPWKKGDMMVLDNILTMHGRATFKGPRRILTSLTAT